jgi:hypothetical protein
LPNLKPKATRRQTEALAPRRADEQLFGQVLGEHRLEAVAAAGREELARVGDVLVAPGALFARQDDAEHQREVVRRGGPKLSDGWQDGTRCHHGRLPKSSTARPNLGIAVADVDWRKDRHEGLTPLPSDSDILKTIIQDIAFGRARAHDTLDRHKGDRKADRRQDATPRAQAAAHAAPGRTHA